MAFPIGSRGNHGPDHKFMDLIFFVKGLLIGFGMAVPVGPIGVLCIRKTLTEGHARGMVVGIGAATADALYGIVAAFGITFISDAIASQQFWLRLIGGALLVFLGIKTLRAKSTEPIVAQSTEGQLESYMTSFFLALTNPVTILAFVAVFAAFGLGHELRILSACLLVLGVFLGSCMWFLGLGYVATFFRKKLDSGGLTWVNRISGTVIIASGLAAFVSVL